ncbi:DUF2075 domain-containing protein [Listeria booriae]|uniref:DUF2075 domain-containing protein n=1 Tax=Listeria booriae TaxID=1552123 RepID=A0A099WEQ7_9LIST|nr:DUF2075 domain-containing protein [Listeria booriae]KGL42590.1 hypothetical protein EP57_03770 [Listeria booriae]MBC1561331.1 DUF2075 domain-containing protein [Listeria booriae]MBC1918617.1 DUF2075 domain-containing protein [Listeria booriae]MBC2048092.1 DUF2075 domain-containing protein [Listeria booriae]
MASELIQIKKFKKASIQEINATYFNNYPIVYILYTNAKKETAYIGQTVHLQRRMQKHLSDASRKKLDTALFIGNEKFNQSATYNIETNLINFFIADKKYELQNKSQTMDSKMHDYYNKEYYDQTFFKHIWEELRQHKVVRESLEDLRNKDVFKLSPYKELSAEQMDLKYHIIDYCKKHINDEQHSIFFIEGDAGTGKSVVLSSTFNTIQDLSYDKSSKLYGTKNYLLVNHQEMLKTYKEISESLPNLKKKSFMKPTSFINQQMKSDAATADIVFVDEAHLLLSKKDSYNNFNQDNHLEEIIKQSKITIVVFDRRQVLKLKSYWDSKMLDSIKKGLHSEVFMLTNQFRIQAEERVLNWIDAFSNKKVLDLPDNKKDSFELKIFSDADKMYQEIRKKNEEYGLSRLVATFDYMHKKDGQDYFIEEGNFKLPWNRTHYKNTWAEQECTIDEVGSIYTIQGFDLNYVGVILGPSVSYNFEKQELEIITTKYEDLEAFRGRDDISKDKMSEIKQQIILNSINVLMKRGINGLYIYASDPKLQQKLMSLYK